MKILCFVTGAIRNDPDDIRKNIMSIKKQIHEDDMCHFVFLTWNPIIGTFFFNRCNVNYYYNYNKDELIEKISDVIDTFIFKDSPDLKLVETCINDAPPIAAYFQTYIHEYLKQSNLQYDYVIKTRNDLLIELNDIYKFFNDSTYIPPCFWLNRVLRNGHFYITSYNKFMEFDFSIQNIKRQTKISWDYEDLDYNLINPVRPIELNDILQYKLQGVLKFHYINPNF